MNEEKDRIEKIQKDIESKHNEWYK
jgi:hypothetical protein